MIGVIVKSGVDVDDLAKDWVPDTKLAEALDELIDLARWVLLRVAREGFEVLDRYDTRLLCLLPCLHVFNSYQ